MGPEYRYMYGVNSVQMMQNASYYEDMCTILQGKMNQNVAKCTQLLVLHCSDEASAGGQTPLIVASQDKKSPQQIYLLL